MRAIEALSDHYIVCGVGRMGRVVVAELPEEEIERIKEIRRNVGRVTAAKHQHLPAFSPGHSVAKVVHQLQDAGSGSEFLTEF